IVWAVPKTARPRNAARGSGRTAMSSIEPLPASEALTASALGENASTHRMPATLATNDAATWVLKSTPICPTDMPRLDAYRAAYGMTACQAAMKKTTTAMGMNVGDRKDTDTCAIIRSVSTDPSFHCVCCHILREVNPRGLWDQAASLRPARQPQGDPGG